MKITIVSRKFIKPSRSTPDDFRKFHISFTDEMSPTMNVPLILYYTCSFNGSMAADERSKFKRILEESLAQVLNQFYPFAGRYVKEDCFVDCNDQGVEYLDAEAIDCQLFQILGPGMKPVQLNSLLPADFSAADEFMDPILSIQVTTFECGSIAIGLSISHRLADAATLSTFVTAWANTAHEGKGKEQIFPVFNSPVFFPGRRLPKLELGISRTTVDNVDGPRVVTKRFIFNGKAISSIRAKLRDYNGTSKNPPTRVQLVSGLILRALLAVDQAKNGQSRASLILQTVNFREKTVPPLPKHSCGNFCVFSKAQCTAEEIKALELEGCVSLIGTAVRKTIADCAKILNTGEDGHMIVIKPFKEVTDMLYNNADQQINAILLNSWCRFPFYEADFGWGKPTWVSITRLPAGNSAVFIDTRDGDGIEAWISLDENDMGMFQEDQRIKAMAI